MIYLFWGKDDFGIQLGIKNIIDKYPGAEITNLKEPDLRLFTELALTDSFFNPIRVINIKGFLPIISKSKDENRLITILQKLPSTTHIIFDETEAPKSSLVKFFKDNAQVSHLDKPNIRDVINYIREKTDVYKIVITPLAAERLAGFVGPNYWQLGEEIKKLYLYKKDDQLDRTIDVSDIDELVKATFEANIFELMDAISVKNTNRAITLLDSFLDSGENEIYILSMITRQFRNIAMAKLEKGISESTLAKKAGIHPYVAKKSLYQARNFTEVEISNVYDRILKADFALKSGQNPRQALQQIIVQ